MGSGYTAQSWVHLLPRFAERLMRPNDYRMIFPMTIERIVVSPLLGTMEAAMFQDDTRELDGRVRVFRRHHLWQVTT
jgi:hypothetical protein